LSERIALNFYKILLRYKIAMTPIVNRVLIIQLGRGKVVIFFLFSFCGEIRATNE